MKTKSLIIAIAVTFLFYQCNKVIEEPIGPDLGPIHKHYVNSYIKLDSIDFTIGRDTTSYWKDKSFGLKYKSGEIYSLNQWQSNSNKAEFNKLAKLYNDTAFNDHASFCFHSEPCLTDTIMSIDIICTNKAYNQTHPINSKLNDIINIGYALAKEYIDNHYPTKGDSINSGYRCISLEQFNKHPNILIGMRDIGFRLSEQPSETADFIFSITLVLKNGKIFTHTYNPIRIR